MSEKNRDLIPFSLDPERVHQQYLDDIARNVGFFVENPYLKLGDSDSGHGVMFGKLSPYGEVSIKPHETFGRAQHEVEVINHAREKGLDTIDPLYIAAGGLRVYMISSYYRGLRNLGQLNWREDVASRRLHKVLTPTLHFAANFAGEIHEKGITHGDFQVKNVALTTEGSPVFVDVENGQIRLKGQELVRKGDRDLVRMSYSVLRRGLLHDRSMKYKLGYLGDEFVDPALEAEKTPTSIMKDRRTEVLDRIAYMLLHQAKSKHPAGKKVA